MFSMSGLLRADVFDCNYPWWETWGIAALVAIAFLTAVSVWHVAVYRDIPFRLSCLTAATVSACFLGMVALFAFGPSAVPAQDDFSESSV